MTLNNTTRSYVVEQLRHYRDRLAETVSAPSPETRRVRADSVMDFVCVLLGVHLDGALGPLIAEIGDLFVQCVFHEPPESSPRRATPFPETGDASLVIGDGFGPCEDEGVFP